MSWQHEASVPKHFCKTPTYCTLSACFSWVQLWVFFLALMFSPWNIPERCRRCFSLMHLLQRCVKRDHIDTRWDVVPSRFQTERQQRMCKYPRRMFPRDLYIKGGGGARVSSTTTPGWETGNHNNIPVWAGEGGDIRTHTPVGFNAACLTPLWVIK